MNKQKIGDIHDVKATVWKRMPDIYTLVRSDSEKNRTLKIQIITMQLLLGKQYQTHTQRIFCKYEQNKL